MKYYSVGTYLVKKQKKINSVKRMVTYRKKVRQPIFSPPLEKIGTLSGLSDKHPGSATLVK
jgi:hypothetical protein